MEGREPEQSTFSFHHSSHGSTMLHKLLVDVNRPLRHILLKYALKKKIDDIPELVTIGEYDDTEFDTPFDEIMTEVSHKLSEDELQKLLLKHKEEMDSIPIVYPILGVPNGVEVEIHYKIRGDQCQSILTRQFTGEPIRTAFQTRDYDDYLIIQVIGNHKNEGIVQTIQSKKGSHLEVFYDINDEDRSNMFCNKFACNLPNIRYNYKANFNVGLIEFINTSSERLMTPTDSETDRVIRYPGASFDMETNGYLHAYSNESQNRSLLNLIMNGSGIMDWPEDKYERFLGIKSRIPRSSKIIINIYGSHCLNPQIVGPGEISNVIPFITDYNQEWSRMYLDELMEGAELEREYRKDMVEEAKEGLQEIEGDINFELESKDIYTRKQKTFKKPLLDDEPLPKDWVAVEGEHEDKSKFTYYRNEVTGQITVTRMEIPYITGKRKSSRLRGKLLYDLESYLTYGELIEETEEELESLKGKIPGLEEKIDKYQKNVKKADAVRKTASRLYQQDVEGELGEMLSTKRRKKGRKSKKDKTKKKTKKRKKKTKKRKKKTKKLS